MDDSILSKLGHVSTIASALGKCYGVLACTLNNVPDTKNPEVLKILGVGREVHENKQLNLLKKLKPISEKELKDKTLNITLPPELLFNKLALTDDELKSVLGINSLRISGRVDRIERIDGILTVVDLKTVKNKRDMKFHPYFHIQVGIYCKLIQLHHQKNLTPRYEDKIKKQWFDFNGFSLVNFDEIAHKIVFLNESGDEIDEKTIIFDENFSKEVENYFDTYFNLIKSKIPIERKNLMGYNITVDNCKNCFKDCLKCPISHFANINTDWKSFFS
jgi:hypothetical protein